MATYLQVGVIFHVSLTCDTQSWIFSSPKVKRKGPSPASVCSAAIPSPAWFAFNVMRCYFNLFNVFSSFISKLGSVKQFELWMCCQEHASALTCYRNISAAFLKERSMLTTFTPNGHLCELEAKQLEADSQFCEREHVDGNCRVNMMNGVILLAWQIGMIAWHTALLMWANMKLSDNAYSCKRVY